MPPSQFDVVVVGGANWDYLIRGDLLPEPGETRIGSDFQEGPGGKGANQAVAAARLGAKVAFLGRVGNDPRGHDLVARLRGEGVDVRAVSYDSRAATGVALILVENDGEKMILTAPGANHELTAAHITRQAALLRRTRVVLIQFELPMDTVCRAAELAAVHGARLVLDPAPPARAPARLLKRVELLRSNASEAEVLSGVRSGGIGSARKAALKLLKKGTRAVVLAVEGKGDLLVWAGGEKLFPRLPVRAIDATGAGDAFAAGLAVATAEGRTFTEAAAFGSAAAALTTTKIGAQAALPNRESVLKLMERSGYDRESRAFRD